MPIADRLRVSILQLAVIGCTAAFAPGARAGEPRPTPTPTPTKRSAKLPPLENNPCVCDPAEWGCTLSSIGWRRASAACLPPKPEPHYWTAAALSAVGLAGQTAGWYLFFRRAESHVETASAWSRFSPSVIRFDSNPLVVNYIAHPWAGAFSYGTSRLSGLSVGASYGMAFATSALWEHIEYRGRISLTDLLVTPGAGLPLGEFFSRLVTYAWDGWHSDESGSNSLKRDDLIWHEFRATYDVNWVDTGAGSEALPLGLSASGKFVAIPGYMRPGNFFRWFADANISDVHLHGEYGKNARALEFAANAVIAGGYLQEIHHQEDGLHGATVMVGLGTGLQFRHEDHDNWFDAYGIYHLPGLSTNARALFGPAQLEAGLDLNFDFGSINAPAYDDWLAENPEVVTKSPLRSHGYYQALGASGRVKISLTTKWLGVGGAGWLGYYQSVEGIDRRQEDVEDDTVATDSILDLEGWVRAGFADQLYVQWTFESYSRTSTLGEFSAAPSLTRNRLSLGGQF